MTNYKKFIQRMKFHLWYKPKQKIIHIINRVTLIWCYSRFEFRSPIVKKRGLLSYKLLRKIDSDYKNLREIEIKYDLYNGGMINNEDFWLEPDGKMTKWRNTTAR